MAAGFHFAQPERGCLPTGARQRTGNHPAACAGTALYLAALNTDITNPAQFMIRYTDGADVTVPVNICNWLEPPSYGEPLMLRSHYLRTPAAKIGICRDPFSVIASRWIRRAR